MVVLLELLGEQQPEPHDLPQRTELLGGLGEHLIGLKDLP